jgi:hypothetical protein
MLCNPVLFGRGLPCVSTATQAQRNSAFAQCLQQFSSSGKTFRQVALEIDELGLASEADDLFSLANRICTSGVQAGTGMCRNLRERVEGVRAARESSRPPLEASRERRQERPRSTPEVRREPLREPRGSETALRDAVRSAARIREVTQDVGQARCPDNPTLPPYQRPAVLPRIHCNNPRELSNERASGDDHAAFLRENNVTITRSIQNPVHLDQFVRELRRFPEPLRRELVSQGARIHILHGNSVAEDPSWTEERNRAPAAQRANWDAASAGRSWAASFDANGRLLRPGVVGSGGNVAPGTAITPTRIVVNHLYHNHGSSNLVLHEYAHALDTLYGTHSISSSRRWQQAVRNSPGLMEFVRRYWHAGTTADAPIELFAELFAYYHSCPEAKQQLENEFRPVADFFRNLTSVRELLRAEGRLN